MFDAKGVLADQVRRHRMNDFGDGATTPFHAPLAETVNAFVGLYFHIDPGIEHKGFNRSNFHRGIPGFNFVLHNVSTPTPPTPPLPGTNRPFLPVLQPQYPAINAQPAARPARSVRREYSAA
jgi:hypothetical protein